MPLHPEFPILVGLFTLAAAAVDTLHATTSARHAMHLTHGMALVLESLRETPVEAHSNA